MGYTVVVLWFQVQNALVWKESENGYAVFEAARSWLLGGRTRALNFYASIHAMEIG